MHKSVLLLAALGSMAALAGFTLPAAAESGDGSCAAHGTAATAEPLNLDAIPVKPVTGKMAVKGAGDDECDDAAVGPRAAADAEHDSTSGEDMREVQDD